MQTISMEIEQRSSGTVLVLSKEDLMAMRTFFETHLLVPKLNSINEGETLTDSWEIFGQLLRAFDLLLENKKEDKYE
jgi:hypothetical protein